MVAQSRRRANGRPSLTASRPADLRAAVYHRVSSEEQVQGYSLDAQDRATRLYCELHGWTITAVYRDEGKSARADDLAKRPEFARMLEDAEAGLFDVLIVHKLDRFARNVIVTLTTLDQLGRLGIGFVSISEQMDFSTPQGRMFLTMLAGFAAYYSDNLSMETKKGKAERKAQGLYNGLLPFGVKANRDGIAVPDPETYPGLLLAFKLAAEGKSDGDVAEAPNAAGYRTTGNQGRNPFSKDTVRRLLTNRFFLGELPDGEGGWLPGKHDPMLDADLFDEAQRTRAANRTGSVKVTDVHRQHSLSGLGICGHCGGRLHILTPRNGRARIYCYQRGQVRTCPQRSAYLDIIEAQIAGYLGTFRLPDELVADIVRVYTRAADARNEGERRRRDLTGRLERLSERYQWGDITREAYLADRERLQAELATLTGTRDMAAVLTRAATLLRDLPAAWATATPEERNQLARMVFQSVEVRDDRLVAVTVQPEFAPFFAVFSPKNDDTPDPDGSGCQGSRRGGIEDTEATGFPSARLIRAPGFGHDWSTTDLATVVQARRTPDVIPSRARRSRRRTGRSLRQSSRSRGFVKRRGGLECHMRRCGKSCAGSNGEPTRPAEHGLRHGMIVQ